MLSKVRTDLIPTVNLGNVCEFTYERDVFHEGRTSQRPTDRIKQKGHLAIRTGTNRCRSRCQPKQKCKSNQDKPESDSAFGTDNQCCVWQQLQ